MKGIETAIVCPNCRAERIPGEVECSRCGIIFAKYRPLFARPVAQPGRASAPRWAWLRAWLVDLDETRDGRSLYGRALLLLVLIVWGSRFILAPVESNYAGESVLHLVNLPFHEAGHVLFMPFGRFMTILGGSLGQLLMPLICVGTFLVRTRDPFAASVALWWTAESLMDLAPYINDARALELVLLGGVTGQETDGHDWNNLLTMLGWLDYDHHLAAAAQTIGILLMLLSWAWGALLLRRQYRRRQMPAGPPRDW